MNKKNSETIANPTLKLVDIGASLSLMDAYLIIRGLAAVVLKKVWFYIKNKDY